MTATRDMFDGLPSDRRERLREVVSDVSFPGGTRIFEEGRRADRFWVVRSGQVALDLHVPGRQAAVVDTVGPGELLGWSWLLPPYVWHLGAQAVRTVDAEQYDATVVRALCEADPVFGRAMYRVVAEVVAARLRGSRTRLLDLYGPQGSGAGRE
ncbi:cyclic nucleotide-binding domain-containing protein [Streptomyces sp. NBC_01267]|uniref:Crp/Fnr family transcriptional regulator n=1 Tax=unclassified Streptomyces TaxID=2593676 RepID=UPI002254146F|nr:MULTISPECIES: cyclic nucleotide-binding domain-containing protein [unclassified Streptomyces]MCX4553488.1 cyclic nucleotide-binding domain-containing protein [Streptomyces sp. NBC_01500]WSC18444.1 cyclic nucleotide-binding domain-containing protein [Streptomyces sp. NBC_01766]WSV52484.1 cyclic nucleotide-binding domain-containing protein [Streptomyces sp. NBC_01014]